MANVHLVQHTHWDREWYFTAEDARLLSDQLFTEALDELKRNPKATFCLDGQSSVVDDYLELRPERLEDIKSLMAEGRLHVGPWYTQTDALLVGAESILHNLMVGVHDTRKKYGEPMMIGYLPDTFGFNAQLPAILEACGIDSFIGWRGINFKSQSPSPYFVWKSLGGHAVYAANMPHGYSMGVMPVEVIDRVGEFVEKKLDPESNFVYGVAADEDILMSCGVDQKSMILDYDKVVEGYNEASEHNNVISTYPAFIDLMREQDDLPEYQGEMREPVYARVHRSIGSVRTQMKQQNFDLEEKLLRRVEPLMVIAGKLGIDVSTGALLRSWKKLLENHAHDSMGGCVSDNVAEDIFHRLKEANEIADGIENLITKRLADDLGLKSNEVLVFNTDPYPFSGDKLVHVVASSKDLVFEGSEYAVVENERYYPSRQNVMMWGAVGLEMTEEPAYYELDVRIHVDLPAFGYRIVEFTEGSGSLEEYCTVESTSISNGIYALSFADGKVSLAVDGKEPIEDFVVLTDQGNAGDTYDYSPIEGEEERVLRFDSAEVREATGCKQMLLKGSGELPVDLDDRDSAQGQTRTVSWCVTLSLTDSDVIEGSVVIDNTVFSHRMRLRVRSAEASALSTAQIQAGFLTRERVEAPEDWAENFVEKPAPIEIFDKSVSAPCAGSTLTVFVDGIKEYEKLDSDLYITLMATTGQLGKSDLAWRPGRASGDTTFAGHIMMETPLAQEIGKHRVTFGIRIVAGELDEAEIARIAERRLAPSVTYQLQQLNLFIHRLDNKIWRAQYPKEQPRELSLFELEGEPVVSAMMPSLYEKGAMIVRLVNPTGKECKVPAYLLEHAERVNAFEESIDEKGSIGAYEFATFKLSL